MYDKTRRFPEILPEVCGEPMPRKPQLAQPLRVNVLVDRIEYEKVTLRHPNFSKWVRAKITEELNRQESVVELEQKLSTAQFKKTEAEIIQNAAKKEAEDLALQLAVLRNPSSTLQQAREQALKTTVAIIAKAKTPTRAYELAEIWSGILKDKGVDLSVAQLLKLVDESKNTMFR